MTNPLVFYNKEDQWQVPVLDVGQNSSPMQPYYTIMTAAGRERQTEFIQMLPFTPRAKDNLAAWMVGAQRPRALRPLLVFQFPKQKIVFGPRQIVGRINQDQVISPQITLWNQQGSQVIWGTLLVIPINESLLYVRPLYLRSPQTRIPELKRVVVAYQTARIVMAETLVQALAQIFGREVLTGLPPDRRTSGGLTMPPPSELTPVEVPAPGAAALPTTTVALIAEMQAAYERGDKAMREGDLGRYQQEMKRIKELLDKLAKNK